MKVVEKKTRILWICNIMLPIVAEKEGVEKNVYGGWLTGMLDGLIKKNEFNIGVSFPYEKKIKGYANGLFYQSFQMNGNLSECYPKNVENQIKEMIDEFKPDILHIFGTEYIHSLAAVNAFNNPEKTIINIQGLVSIIARHYCLGLPEKVKKGYTIADRLLKRSPMYAQKDFRARGEYERQAIKKAGYIIGRTDWDRACVQRINPHAMYHFCNETLRDVFYESPKWSYEKCMKHTIFMSQVSYPVKGFQFAIETIYELKKSFSDLKVFIAGPDIHKMNWKKRILMDSYTNYILRKIKKYKLENVIEFIGNLSAEEMKQQYLRCNAFLSASTIENESNSLSEAKMLGVPSVASYVGGITNRIHHGIDGYLYPCDEPYMAAYYIKKIFMEEDKIQNMSERSIKSMEGILDKEANLFMIQKIYREIAQV